MSFSRGDQALNGSFNAGCGRSPPHGYRAGEGQLDIVARALFVSAAGQVGGAETSLLLLVTYLRKRHEVSVACPVDGRLQEQLGLLGCQCYALPGRHGGGKLVGYATWCGRASLRLRSIARQTRAQLVHANTVYAAVLTPLTAATTKCRLVWHARDCIEKPYVHRSLGRIAGRVIAVSNAVRHELIQQGVAPASVRVVHNGVADDQHVPLPRLRTGGATGSFATERAVTFANIGQFVPWKKQEQFIEAASVVAGSVPSACFWLVGDNSFAMNRKYRAGLGACVRRHGLQDRVSFVEWSTDMHKIWGEVDCLVHTADCEPFGRVIVEALAAGIPVIAVNAGGPSEIIQHERTGLLVRPRDASAIAEAMGRLASEPCLASALADSARKMVYARFRAEDTARRVAEIYDEVLAN